MKFTQAIFLSIIILSIGSSFISSDTLPIGSSLPMGDHKMNDIHGREVTMQEAKKQNGLLVMFSCNACPYVIRNQERTKAVCSFAMQNNIGVILLNSNENQRDDEDSYDAMKAYAASQDYKWYYAVDKANAVADAFGANRTPECFLFSSSLKLTYHGAIDDNPTNPENVTRQHLREAIREMLAGKEVSVKESRSVGCAIKRR
ncbi:MAG: thioredoxin family protein [Ginsengibacter sp.]